MAPAKRPAGWVYVGTTPTTTADGAHVAPGDPYKRTTDSEHDKALEAAGSIIPTTEETA